MLQKEIKVNSNMIVGIPQFNTTMLWPLNLSITVSQQSLLLYVSHFILKYKLEISYSCVIYISELSFLLNNTALCGVIHLLCNDHTVRVV